jgi:hypothetical protein
LAVTTAADAAIVASLEITNPTLTSLPGYVGVVIRLTSDEGNITAFDFGGTDPTKPDERNKGVFYSQTSGGINVPGLHQRWGVGDDGLGGAVDQPTPRNQTTTALVTNPLNRDSYFSQGIAETAVVYPAEENNDKTGSPLSPTNNPNPGGFNFGIGTELHYTSGISLASQAAQVTLAYLTVPETGFVHLRGEIATGPKTPIDVYLAIPEPMSASLMGFGGLALLARRRRA